MGHRWLLVVALAVAGCYSSKGGGAKAPSNTAAPALAPVVSKHAHLARTIADPLGFLPVDSEIVLHIDTQRVRRSALWRQYEPMLMQAASNGLPKVSGDCGLDIIANLGTLRFGFKDIGDHVQGVMVVTGINNAKLRTCMVADKQSGDFVIDGDVMVGTSTKGQEMALELVGASTVVLVMGTGTDRARLDAVLNSGAPLRTSPAFVDIFSTLNTQSALWFAMNGSSKAFDQTAGLGFRPKALFGSVGLVDGLSASMRIRMESPGSATQLTTMISGQIGALKSFVDRLDVAADANDVTLELGMTDAQVSSIVSMLGGLAGLSSSPPQPQPAPTGGTP